LKIEISAVLPTIGRINYLDKSIKSILDQKIPFDEIIVFDNSKEQNLKQLSIFSENELIKWIKAEQQIVDPIKSWNTAVSYATKQFFSFIGDDDLLLDNFVSEGKKYLDSVDLVFLKPIIIDENDIEISTPNFYKEEFADCMNFIHSRFKKETSLFLPGSIINKAHFNRIGGFVDSGIPGFYFPDDLLYFQLSIISRKVAFSQKETWCYRTHSEQIGKINTLKGFSKKAMKYIDLLDIKLKENFNDEIDIYGKYYNRKKYLDDICKFGAVKYLFSSKLNLFKLFHFFLFFFFDYRISIRGKFSVLMKSLNIICKIKNEN